jgi:predicted RNA-binding Zn ribbon-like protein
MSWPSGSAAVAAQRTAALTAVLRPSEPGEPVGIPDVARVLRDYGEPEPIELTDADITQLRAVAADLHAVFAASSTAAAARRLNRLLGACAGPPRLTDHHGTAWHLHVDASDGGPWAQWLATSGAMALAALLTGRQAKPGGLCAAIGCRRPFIDLGRGAARRYCSTRCASRARVAAHRRSHAALPQT